MPLACADAVLAVLNVTTVIDALDLDRSVVARFPSSGRIMNVESHVFRPERLQGVQAFKVPELLRGSVFVNEDVVAHAEAPAVTSRSARSACHS